MSELTTPIRIDIPGIGSIESADLYLKSEADKVIAEKYKLTDETKIFLGRTLHRIVCVTAFANVSAGEVGGWIESKNNLDQYGDAWVYGNAKVYGLTDLIVMKNSWSSGRYFTYTISNKKWKVGCFHGTGEELIKKAYVDSELSGKCYEATVKYVEEIERIKQECT